MQTACTYVHGATLSLVPNVRPPSRQHQCSAPTTRLDGNRRRLEDNRPTHCGPFPTRLSPASTPPEPLRTPTSLTQPRRVHVPLLPHTHALLSDLTSFRISRKSKYIVRTLAYDAGLLGSFGSNPMAHIRTAGCPLFWRRTCLKLAGEEKRDMGRARNQTWHGSCRVIWRYPQRAGGGTRRGTHVPPPPPPPCPANNKKI